MCVIFLLMVKLNCILLKGNKTLLSSQLFGCHFSPCLLFSPFWTFCICFTTAYCFEITVVFMAAALAPEYNPLLSLLFMCLPCCGLLRTALFFSTLLWSLCRVLSALLGCPLAPRSLLFLFCPALLFSPYICSALFYFYSVLWRAALPFYLLTPPRLSSCLLSSLL